MAKTMNIDPRDIIRAAKSCLQQKGLSATTLKDVAAKAGVTQGTVYYHFKTKEELMAAVIDLTHNESLEAMERTLVSAGDVHSRISTVMDITRDVYGRNDEFKKLFFNMAAMALHNRRAAEEFSRSGKRAIDMIEKLYLKINDTPALSFMPSDHMARIIAAVITGLALQSIFHEDMDIDSVYESFKQMLQDSVSQKVDGEQGGSQQC